MLDGWGVDRGFLGWMIPSTISSKLLPQARSKVRYGSGAEVDIPAGRSLGIDG